MIANKRLPRASGLTKRSEVRIDAAARLLDFTRPQFAYRMTTD